MEELIEKSKYRIIQTGNKDFRIQVYSSETKGILWWKKEVWSWKPTDLFGGVWVSTFSYPASLPFDSLDGAKKQIDTWNFKQIIHEV